MSTTAPHPPAKIQIGWALDITRAAGLLDAAVAAPAALYAALAPVTAAVEGFSWLLLVSLFSGAASAPQAYRLLAAAQSRWGMPSEEIGLLVLVTALFALKALLTIVMAALEAYIGALLRRRVQESIVRTLILGRWKELALQNVGRWMGALMEETAAFTKILTSSLQCLYASVMFLGLMALALAIDARLSLLVAGLGGPLWLLLRLVYGRQTSLSHEQTRERQGFASDANERLSGLFQIKAGDEAAAQLALALRHQEAMQRLEVRIGLCYGLLSAVNPILFSVMLGAFTAWALRSGAAPQASVAALGGVGILALRAAVQLNIFIAALGNLSRLSGCLKPLHRALATPPEPPRAPVPEPLASLRFDAVSVVLAGSPVLKDISVRVAPGRLLLVAGPSGSGKTTFANLLAGLLEPDTGRVLYQGASGKEYPVSQYRARIGYVPQDVHLFSGSVRENLDPEARLSDAALWESLTAAGAKDFVARLGGLDAAIAEAGRSLSGGEKRRLAIAKTLARNSDCLVLDEITNGLDEKTKAALVKTIAALARERLVVAITHDLAAFEKVPADRLDLAAVKGATS